MKAGLREKRLTGKLAEKEGWLKQQGRGKSKLAISITAYLPQETKQDNICSISEQLRQGFSYNRLLFICLQNGIPLVAVAWYNWYAIIKLVQLNLCYMLKNYCLVAWRNLTKNPFYTVVNIAGLSAGIAFTLFIAAFVWNELRVNEQLKNAGDQYLIQSKWKNPSEGFALTTMGPLAKALREQYPNLVANYCRWDGITSTVSRGTMNFREGIQLCDSTMLTMFGFRLLEGEASKALQEPFSVVITTEKALKYFGQTHVLGQTLSIESFSGSRHDFLVTGVMEKPFKNSVTFLNDDNDNQVYISAANLPFFGRNMDWPNPYIVGYVQLQPGIRPKDLEKPMQQLMQQHAPQQAAADMQPYLVPLKTYYLSANNGLVKKMLFALSAIAGFILLMAVINFIHLSISRAAGRMREIGIRKVLGGLKRQLILQFLVESIVLVAAAMAVALGSYALFRGLFSQVLGKPIPPFSAFPFYFLALPVLLVLLLGVTAGIYPAFVLSSLKSAASLKGKLSSVKDRVLLRKSLVVFQFGTATVVLVCAILISQQVALFFSRDLGYNKDLILSAQAPRNWTPEGVRRLETLRQQFLALPQVKAVSLSFEVPNGNNGNNFGFFQPGADSTHAISAQVLMTDEYFATTYGIPLLAGVFFTPAGAGADPSKLVINETMARTFGWKTPQDALGRQLRYAGSAVFTVAGVTQDFHFGSMQGAIQPLAFVPVQVNNAYRVLSFKLYPGNKNDAVNALQQQWASILPGAPFEYTFMEESLSRLYKTEIQLKKAAYLAAGLSLVIVLLGVIGLVTVSVRKRTKEIGIRKVLGSSVKGIFRLFLKDFMAVVLVAGLLACPLAYLVMHHWLNNYVYRIYITPLPFISAVLLLGSSTAGLILLQTWRAARESPIKHLRTE